MKNRRPKNSVGTVLERVGILYSACRQDKEELLLVGLPWEKAELLPELLDKCAFAQSELTITREEWGRKKEELDTYIKECRDFRTRFADEIREVFKIEKIDYNVPGFKKTSRVISSLAQDLNDLAVLYRKSRPFLKQISYAEHLENEAVNRAMSLDEKMPQYRVYKKSAIADAVKKRNDLYLEVYDLYKEICCYGRRAFPDDPRRKNYCTIK
jgi:hypothetical protein